MSPIAISVPTRIADLGGWTDTWFAQHGLVCHLAVWPGVDVTVQPVDGPPGLEVRLGNFARAWRWTPGLDARTTPDPLIAACLDEAGVPPGAWILDVRSDVPPGASNTPEAIRDMTLLFAIAPVALMSLAGWLMWRWPLGPERHAAVQAALAARDNAPRAAD